MLVGMEASRGFLGSSVEFSLSEARTIMTCHFGLGGLATHDTISLSKD